MNDLAVARAIHVLAVTHWIGGLAFVTLVILPLAAARSPDEGLTLFDAVERRFAAQVRFSVPVAGLSGLWMAWRLEIWVRFVDPTYWWMTAMLALWVVFMLILFVAEPLLEPMFARGAARGPAALLRGVCWMHAVLLALAVITVIGSVAGAHGFMAIWPG
jgi:uncharacterized membrane protein